MLWAPVWVCALTAYVSGDCCARCVVGGVVALSCGVESAGGVPYLGCVVSGVVGLRLWVVLRRGCRVLAFRPYVAFQRGEVLGWVRGVFLMLGGIRLVFFFRISVSLVRCPVFAFPLPKDCIPFVLSFCFFSSFSFGSFASFLVSTFRFRGVLVFALRAWTDCFSQSSGEVFRFSFRGIGWFRQAEKPPGAGAARGGSPRAWRAFAIMVVAIVTRFPPLVTVVWNHPNGGTYEYLG